MWMVSDSAEPGGSTSPPVKVGSYTLGPATDFDVLARETLEGGGLTTTHQEDAPLAVGALYNVREILIDTPLPWDRG